MAHAPVSEMTIGPERRSFWRQVQAFMLPRPGLARLGVIVLLFGIWLAIGHLVSAAAMAVTIIGIPLALANLKLIPVSLMPLGKEIVPVDSPAPFARVPA